MLVHTFCFVLLFSKLKVESYVESRLACLLSEINIVVYFVPCFSVPHGTNEI